MDFIALPQTTSGSTDDSPTAIPAELGRLFDRLDADARSSGTRLNQRLQQTVDQHDLDRKELLTAHRNAIRLDRADSLAGPTEYWQQSALPRAALLVDPSMAALVDVGDELGRKLDRFLLDLDDVGHPWTDTETGRAASTQASAQAIDRMLQAVPSSHTIHSLGSWWHRRLRRAAVLRSLPLLPRAGFAGQMDIVIGRAELDLLNGPPWAHGDRLLSAFELAHSEIRTQTELVMEGLTARVARRGRPYLDPKQRVTIELRH